MLYVFECIINLIFISNAPLETTGKSMSINDIGVGFLGVMVIIAIIWFVVHSAKFCLNKKKLQNKDGEEKKYIKDRYSDYLISILYYFECYILIFYWIFHRKSFVMKTTGQKPSKNEIAVSVVWWIYTILIIFSIILITL